jgi:hypothetical protein
MAQISADICSTVTIYIYELYVSNEDPGDRTDPLLLLFF